MEELSGKAEVSTLDCPEQTQREALSALAELVCQERTIHRDYFIPFYSTLFMPVPSPAQPRAGTGGQAGEGSGAAMNSQPRWQTCHCGSRALGHRDRQQGGRREGRKELWKTKLFFGQQLWIFRALNGQSWDELLISQCVNTSPSMIQHWGFWGTQLSLGIASVLSITIFYYYWENILNVSTLKNSISPELVKFSSIPSPPELFSLVSFLNLYKHLYIDLVIRSVGGKKHKITQIPAQQMLLVHKLYKYNVGRFRYIKR